MFVKIGASVMNELVSVIPMDTAMYMFNNVTSMRVNFYFKKWVTSFLIWLKQFDM